MKKSLKDACETINKAVLKSKYFEKAKNMEELFEYMLSWNSRMEVNAMVIKCGSKNNSVL